MCQPYIRYKQSQLTEIRKKYTFFSVLQLILRTNVLLRILNELSVLYNNTYTVKIQQYTNTKYSNEIK